MTVIPDMPPIPCPDCDAQMRLQPMPERWRRDSKARRWVYLCERYGDACRGLLSAHPDGSPVGRPVPKPVRQARRRCHDVFDRLWLYPEKLYSGRVIRDHKERARLRGVMRGRAYHYIADRLGMAEPDCHIGKITDVETLRRFYAEALQASPAEIRRWWKMRDGRAA